jgi:hypothetical protein
VAWAEFVEREYELAANIELANSGTMFHTPAQILEEILGYDVALDPRDPLIWTLLQEAAPPGVFLMPNLWLGDPVAPADLPSFHVSLLLQYKRPQHMVGSNARQWSHWGRPYYRISTDDWQHRTLLALESALVDEAVVRYAAPSFHERRRFEDLHRARSVLQQSVFVGPGVIGTSHSVWTYDRPGIAGYANPEPEIVDLDDFDSLVSVIRETARPSTLREHLSALSQHLLEEPQGLSIEGRAALFTLGASEETVSLVDVVLDVAARITSSAASWWVAEFGLPNP